ncbi:hypothetical protein CDAR_94101 [Caerostris darwini]|uniref:Uncharacterized protein n=1 Tax=Caerostris darwini TaxID=1538125 RepID=A0AAV4NL69_9ARAC|nr:hypothetical protein CDAR_94101 [Caerostris darwini]
MKPSVSFVGVSSLFYYLFPLIYKTDILSTRFRLFPLLESISPISFEDKPIEVHIEKEKRRRVESSASFDTCADLERKRRLQRHMLTSALRHVLWRYRNYISSARVDIQKRRTLI